MMALGVVSAGTSSYMVYKDYLREKEVEVKEFSLTDSQFKSDVVGKSMLVPQLGQSWGFTAEQQIDFKTVEKKSVGDSVVVVGHMAARAAVKTDKKTTAASMEGVVKLVYENVGKEWFLVAVEPVSVKVANE